MKLKNLKIDCIILKVKYFNFYMVFKLNFENIKRMDIIGLEF